MITCELLAVYWEKKYNVFADLNNIWQLSRGRDVRKEAAANQLVRACFSAYDARKHQMILQGADEMYEFLSSSMEDLQKLGEIFISDRLKAIRVIPSPKVSVGVSLAENVLANIKVIRKMEIFFFTAFILFSLKIYYTCQRTFYICITKKYHTSYFLSIFFLHLSN